MAAAGAAALVGVAAPAAHAAGPAAHTAGHSGGAAGRPGRPGVLRQRPRPDAVHGLEHVLRPRRPDGGPGQERRRHLVSSGLQDSGYDIVWLDGGWQADTPRDDQGRLAANKERFPSGIPALVTYLHQHGLRAGIYTDAGDLRRRQELRARQPRALRAGRQAVRGLEVRRGQGRLPLRDRREARPGAPRSRSSATPSPRPGRPMLLNFCNPLTDDWGLPHTPAQDAHNAYTYGPTTADSWRTGTDIAFGTPYRGRVAQHPAQHGRQRLAPRGAGARPLQRPRLPLPMRKIAGRLLRAERGGVHHPAGDLGRDGLPAGHRLRPAHPARSR